MIISMPTVTQRLNSSTYFQLLAPTLSCRSTLLLHLVFVMKSCSFVPFSHASGDGDGPPLSTPQITGWENEQSILLHYGFFLSNVILCDSRAV